MRLREFEHAPVRFAEQPGKLFGPQAGEVHAGERNRNLEGLAQIAHLQHPVEIRLRLDPECRQIIPRFRLQGLHGLADGVHICLRDREPPGPGPVMHMVGKQQAGGGEHAGMGRHDDGADGEVFGHSCRMQRARAAIGHQHIVARVAPAFGGDPLDGAHDAHLSEADHAVGDLLDHEAKPGGQRLQRPAGRLRVHRHAPAEKSVRPERAAHQMGVRHCRPVAAAPVAGRPRRRAGGVRADAQQAAVIDPGDGAAAGPDRHDVDHRRLHRQAVDAGHGGKLGPAVGDQRDIGAGAAHVERDQVAEACAGHAAHRADRARRGAGEQRGDGVQLHGLGRHPPAIGLHDREPPGEAPPGQRGGEPADISRHDRLHIGRERGGRGALIFPEFPRDVARAGDRQRRRRLLDDRRNRPFVVRIGVGMQETERRRLISALRQRLPDEAGGGGAVRCLEHLAVGCHPFINLEHVAPRHDRLGLAVAQVVDRVLVVALEQHPPAIGLHDREPPGEAPPGQRGGEPADISRHDRLHIGRERGGRGALIFPEFPRDVARAGDRQRRRRLLDDRRNRPFVVRIGVGMQETERRRLISALRQRLPDEAGGGGAVRCLEHLAVGCHPFINLEHVAPRHDRLGLAVAQVVDRVLVVALEQQQVAGALGHEQADRGALAFEHGVGRHGRAVDELLDLRRVEAGGVERVHGAEIRARRRARHLRRQHGPALDRHQVGEGPACFNADAHARSRFSPSPLPG